MQNSQAVEKEEVKTTLTLAGEVYYFLVASLVTVFAVCSMLAGDMSITETISILSIMWVLPFVLIAIYNLFKLIIIRNLAAKYGKKEQ
jgi:cytochrome bd-type quinol oxidase subunit 2